MIKDWLMANRRKEKMVRMSVNFDSDDYKRCNEIARGQVLSSVYLSPKAMQEYFRNQTTVLTHREGE